MPFMDGFAACKKLRAMITKKEIADLPIVACTAGVDERNLNKCKEAGFDDILHKPI